MVGTNEGTVAVWHKDEGDRVQVDEIIADVETDKAAIEIPAAVDGAYSAAFLARVRELLRADRLVTTALDNESHSRTFLWWARSIAT